MTKRKSATAKKQPPRRARAKPQQPAQFESYIAGQIESVQSLLRRIVGEVARQIINAPAHLQALLTGLRFWCVGHINLCTAHIKSMRLWVFWFAALAVIGWYFFTDPSHGAETLVRLQWLAWVAVAAGPVYLLRRALMDGARSNTAYKKAMRTSTGSGLVFLGLCLLTGLLFFALVGRAGAAVPERAQIYLPVLADEISDHWSDLPLRSVLAAQIEQETCITLKHRYCWSRLAQLKTSREYGFGMGQHTRAFRADGSARFDAHAEALAKYPALAGWTFENRFDARMQIRAIVLGNRDCYRRVTQLGPDAYNALAMCDAAHNGGLGGILNERRICAQVSGCDANQWFGNVENHSLKSRVKAGGYGMSWYDINRTHVRNVMITRRPKYAAWFREA